MNDCDNILHDNSPCGTTGTLVVSDNPGVAAGEDLYEIGLCWEDMASPHEVEAWAAYHALTPECLADRLHRLLTGKGCEGTPGEEGVQAADDDPALWERCLIAATSALDHLRDEKAPVAHGIPVVTPVPAAASDVLAIAHAFALEKCHRHLLAAGGIGRDELRAAERRSVAAARRAVGSLLGEAVLGEVGGGEGEQDDYKHWAYEWAHQYLSIAEERRAYVEHETARLTDEEAVAAEVFEMGKFCFVRDPSGAFRCGPETRLHPPTPGLPGWGLVDEDLHGTFDTFADVYTAWCEAHADY
jgi:hypothetical protein